MIPHVWSDILESAAVTVIKVVEVYKLDYTFENDVRVDYILPTSLPDTKENRLEVPGIRGLKTIGAARVVTDLLGAHYTSVSTVIQVSGCGKLFIVSGGK
tara:strand:+ start:625 stop:924 length:300 start_codon:yes stop_codon:yes gene_type:complete